MKNSLTTISGLGIRVLLAINVGIILGYFGLWATAAHNKVLWRADFTIYYTAWDIINAGQGSQLYNLDTQKTYQLDLLQGDRFADDLLPYNHPPYMALALHPLSWFSFSAAYWIFAVIQLVVLVRLLRLLVSIARLQRWDRPEILFLVITFCALPPLFNTLLLGNVTLFVLWGWAELYRALIMQRDGYAAWWYIVTTAKPQHAIFYGLLLLIGRRWKTLFIALGLLSALVLVTTLMLGPMLWPDYIKLLVYLNNVSSQYGIIVKNMVNFKGFLVQVLGGAYFTLINRINLMALGASALGVAWLWRGAWEPQQPVFSLKLAFSLLLGLIFSPHALGQDALLLTFPMFLFYLYLRQQAPAQARALGWLALGSPVILLISEFLLRDELPFHVPFILMLGLAFWMGNILRYSPARSAAV